MPIAPGSRIGAYHVVSLIGEGGMGQVFRARDTRLDRQVAIKSLPDALLADPERTARFEREAKLLATLNHPNIATIHGLEQANGEPFIVMELVDGETLADRIARGPILVDEALPIARQVAEALEAAHEQGIVHRDLKPANIKLRTDGTVKVLDFGLAKALEPAGAVASSGGDSPTITSPALMTGIGVLLGTAAYMSPEQARGRAADKRSDVWAFGCVLYEMLTGRRAFEGEGVSDTIAAVLRCDPDWAALPPTLPPAICALLQGCLRKERDRRIAAIAAAVYILSEQRDAPSTAPEVRRPARANWKNAVGLGVTAIAGVLVGAAVMRNPVESRPVPARFTISLPAGQQFTGAERQFVDISPDGTQLAYIANSRIYVRSISELEPRAIAGTETLGNLTNLTFSPEGDALAFTAGADSTLKRIAVTGGTPITISKLVGGAVPIGVTWTSAGILLADIRGIVRLTSSGGTAEVLVPRPPVEGVILAYPRLLPDGSILFSKGGFSAADPWQLLVHSARTGEQRVVSERGLDARYIATTGHLVYEDGGTIFAVPFDLQRLAVSGGTTSVVEGVRFIRTGMSNAARGEFAFSDTGSLVYVPGPVTPASGRFVISVADRRGRVESLKLPPSSYNAPRVSPDGRWLAFENSDTRETNIWTYDWSGASSPRRLTFGGNNRYPVWAPDSRQIYFQSDRAGDRAIFSQAIDSTAEKLTTPEAGIEHVPNSASPKDDVLLFDATKGSNVSLWTLSLRDDRKASRFGDVPDSTIPTQAVVSPDGQWVAYQAGTLNAVFTFVESMPPHRSKYQIAGGGRPLWSRDGTELFFIPGSGRFAAVAVKTQPVFTFSVPIAIPRAFASAPPLDARTFDVMRDGRFVVVANAGAESTNTVAPQLTVVFNWFEELKRLVPTN